MTLDYNKDKTISFCNLHTKFHACISKVDAKVKSCYDSDGSILAIWVLHLKELLPGNFCLKLRLCVQKLEYN